MLSFLKMKNRYLKHGIILSLSFSSPVYAEGYINENMIIFVSSESAEDDLWKDQLICTPKIENSEQKGIWKVTFYYPNQHQQTSSYLTQQKPKANTCDLTVHFPDQINGTGIFEAYYPNGKQYSRIEYRNGQYHGQLKFWHPNGLLQQESNFVQGISQGEYRIWYPNGQLGLAMRYNKGMQDGMKQRWYENGQPWSYALFKADQLIGELKQWFENGQLERHAKYQAGQLQGETKTWYVDGKPEAVLNYTTGKIVQAQCWGETGQTLSKQSCINRHKGEE